MRPIDVVGRGLTTTFADVARSLNLSDTQIQALEKSIGGPLLLKMAQFNEQAWKQARNHQDAAAMGGLLEGEYDRLTSSLSGLNAKGNLQNMGIMNWKTLLGPTIGKVLELAAALTEQTGNTDQANWTLAVHKNRLVDQLVSSGLSTEAARALVEQLYALGQQKPTPIVDLNVVPFEQKKKPLDSSIANIDSRRPLPVIDAESSRFFSKARTVSDKLDAISRAGASPGIGSEAGKRWGGFFAKGGPILGPYGAPVPVMAHGGEYVLSADVVDRIKRGAPSAGAQINTSGRGTGVVQYNTTVYVQSNANPYDIAHEVTWAQKTNPNPMPTSKI